MLLRTAMDRPTTAPAFTDRSHNPSHPRLSHTHCFSFLWQEQFTVRLFPHPHDYSSVSWKHQAQQAPFLQQSFVRPGLQTSVRSPGLAHYKLEFMCLLQPTPVFLPGESQGQGSLVGCRLWGRTESDTTEET